MNRTKLRPTYSLDEAKSLARLGKMMVNGRVRRHLMNQFGYLDIDHFLADLLIIWSLAILENPLRSTWMALCMVFTQMSMSAEVLNARIGTSSF